MFYLLYFFIIILYTLFEQWEKGKKIYCIVTGLCYFTIAAVRSSTIGFDTGIYVNAFNRLSEMPLNAAMLYSNKDAVFWAMLCLLGKITSNYTVLFSVVAGLFTVSAWHLIYKYSKDPRLSIILLLAFNLYQFTFTGMRQTIAISFILWAIDFCYQEQTLKSIIFILIGALFHSSALVFIIVILLMEYRKELEHIHTFSVALVLGVVFLFRERIAQKLIVFIQDRGYEVTMTNGGLTMTFVIFSLFLLGCLFIREYSFSDENATLSYLIAAIACFFEMLVSTQSIFFRVAFYFLIVYIIFVPNVIQTIKHDSSRRFIKASVYILLSIQYLVFTINSCGIIPYQTFWQV